ncbi:MAG TPA: GNAT family N-acetyltransferase [Roseiflexaceae bacterium]|nr:GNAT family N-acetyltransferase [Roseiflexaceae bacterium]
MTDTQPIAAALAPQGIALRPIGADDMPFLYRVYAGTRAEELAQTDWSDAQKETFLRMQFEAQHHYYQEHYAGAAFQVILHDGQPIGRLYLAHWPDELRIVDITLLAEHRGRAFGSAILTAILDEGRRLGLPVRVHVERFNPALRLYTRLGFRQIADKGVYYFMERSPDVG